MRGWAMRAGELAVCLLPSALYRTGTMALLERAFACGAADKWSSAGGADKRRPSERHRQSKALWMPLGTALRLRPLVLRRPTQNQAVGRKPSAFHDLTHGATVDVLPQSRVRSDLPTRCAERRSILARFVQLVRKTKHKVGTLSNARFTP
jgi:hypothetical protein